METRRAVISILGVLMMLGGLIFVLQGFGVVGPQESYMFENVRWVYNGVLVLVAGGIVIGLGWVLTRNVPG